MCELLGMSANVSTDVCFSFTGLIQRDEGTGPHKDSWDITFYGGRGYRAFKNPQPSFNSPIARLVQDYPIEPCSVITHIRQANRGEVTLENTHPFTRELWGRNWTYAHSRRLGGYKSLETGNFRPVEETDSEKTFCWLLYKLTERYPRTPGNVTAVFKYVAILIGELRKKGVFDMLLSGGHYVVTFCSTNLFWTMCRAPFGVATLLDQDMEIDFSSETTPNDVVTVIATQSLTGNETQQKIMPGRWALSCLGERVV